MKTLLLVAVAISSSCALEFSTPTLVCPDSFDGRPVIVEVGEPVSLEFGLDAFWTNRWTWALEFAPPGSRVKIAQFQPRARARPGVPGLYQFALTTNEATRRCTIRAVDDGVLVADTARSSASVDDILIAGGIARFVFASNDPLIDIDPEVTASPPGVLVGEPIVFTEDDRTIVEIEIDPRCSRG